MRFLAFVLDERRQTAVAMEYNYGPVVPAAWKAIPADRHNIISGGPDVEKTAVFLNADWWAANLQPTTEKFQQWLLG